MSQTMTKDATDFPEFPNRPAILSLFIRRVAVAPMGHFFFAGGGILRFRATHCEKP
jgi:hypothetical protein